jgi:predicted nucleic acid-binding protein
MSADFIDSNVFLYLFDEVNAHKRQAEAAPGSIANLQDGQRIERLVIENPFREG